MITCGIEDRLEAYEFCASDFGFSTNAAGTDTPPFAPLVAL
jgi:hypothetical protein